MIQSEREYERACDELRCLEERLATISRDQPASHKGLTRAGLRKLISRLHEELGVYEGTRESEAEGWTPQNA